MTDVYKRQVYYMSVEGTRKENLAGFSKALLSCLLYTSKTTVEIDGENHNFYFEKSGSKKGAGVTGEKDDKLYQSGMPVSYTHLLPDAYGRYLKGKAKHCKGRILKERSSYLYYGS